MEQTFTELLKKEFEMRQKRNTHYSLRAFARDLGVGLGSLSETLNGKRELSKKNFEKAIDKMLLSVEQKDILRNHTFKNKTSAESPLRTPPILIDENTFKLIADWHYLAILNLAKIKSNSSKPKWVAERLGISEEMAQEALKRLKKIGLLDIKAGKLIRSSRPLTTTRDIPSMALRLHHLGNLKLAEIALFEEPVERRDFGSITMPVNPEKLAKAKELLLKTRVKIGDLLDSGETSEIYTLSFQLFPLTKNSDDSHEKNEDN
jgi:uncharacterized protein (TIGR02147 family)